MEITFESEKDKKDYEHYMTVRGQGTYNMVYSALTLITGNKKIKANDFNGLIRYDKRLRDQIYIYLATAEEYLKNRCNMQLEYYGNKEIKNFTSSVENQIKPSNSYGYNLFKYTAYSFNDLIEIIKTYDIRLNIESEGEKDILLKSVKQLRNEVMHHRFLLLNPLKMKSVVEVQEHLEKVKQNILSLSKILPKKWTMGFLKSVRNANYEKDKKERISKYLYIEV